MTGGPDRVVTAPTLLPSLDPAQVDAVHRLAAAARHTDGAAPLNEHALLHLRDPVGSDSRHLLTTEADRLTGYAYLDLSGDGAMTAECVVAPGSRGRGLGRSLVRALIGASDPRQVTVWSHGDHPAAAAVAAHVGLRRVRELHRMQRPLALELPSLQVPDGIVLRTFVPDVDDAAWVALNARAFADHPEQGRVSVEDLSQRRQQSWFDPAGFFVAERDGVMVGFHWTKVDGDSGEVYVLGVSPDAQGSGLGRVLTLRGLHHLRDAGLDAVHLYVEADNAAALAMYARLGFTTAVVDVLYRWG